jgi:CheY-like chemotaxis protein
MSDKRALVVDDEPADAAFLAMVLERCGVRAEVAVDGGEGLEMMRARRPDLVLLDMMMPVMRGDEVLATMRADPDLRDVPVVVLTSPGGFGDDATYEVPHLRRPFVPVEVERLIREALGVEGEDT